MKKTTIILILAIAFSLTTSATNKKVNCDTIIGVTVNLKPQKIHLNGIVKYEWGFYTVVAEGDIEKQYSINILSDEASYKPTYEDLKYKIGDTLNCKD